MAKLHKYGVCVLCFIFICVVIHSSVCLESEIDYQSAPFDSVLTLYTQEAKEPVLKRRRRDSPPSKNATSTVATAHTDAPETVTSSNNATSPPVDVGTFEPTPDNSSNAKTNNSFVTNAPKLTSIPPPSATSETPNSGLTDAPAPSNSTPITPSGMPGASTPPDSTTATPLSTTPPELNITTITDNHQYYQSEIHNDPILTAYYLKLFNQKFSSGSLNHHYLLRSMNHAVKFKTSFTFPFYGHPQNRITLGTGGFVYLSDFLHPYLMHSQYAAPLMAPLHTYHNSSDMRYLDDGQSFWVLWENVYMKSQEKAGPFTFQLVIFKNGTIIFAYEKLPILPKDMKSLNPPLRIGLSDAYYWDITISWSSMRMRKIIRYHTVALSPEALRPNSVVVFTPLPTCHEQYTCGDCLGKRTNFSCSWCPSIGRCSSGFDRYRQDWQSNSCHTTASVTEECPTGPPLSNVMVGVIFVFLVVVLVVGVSLWCRYAYLNPSSASGIWLLEHRPSVLKAKFSRVMFWKRSGDAGERYHVSFAGTESLA